MARSLSELHSQVRMVCLLCSLCLCGWTVGPFHMHGSCRCEDLASDLLAQPPSADTIRGLDEISDTVRSLGILSMR